MTIICFFTTNIGKKQILKNMENDMPDTYAIFY